MALNYYEMLGVERGATKQQIVKAYRRIMADNHPDRLADLDPVERSIAEEIAKSAGAAYQVLSSASRRDAYDAQLDRSAPPPAAPSSAGSPAPARGEARRRVDLAGSSGTAPRDPFAVSPRGWDWYRAPDEKPASSTRRTPSRGQRLVPILLGLFAWAAWGYVSIVLWHGPLLAINQATDQMTWWLTGLIVHLVISVLTLTRLLWRKWPAILVLGVLALAAAAVLTSGHGHLTSTAFWMAALGPTVAVAGSAVLTVLGPVRAWIGPRRAPTLLDSESFITVGSRALGERPADIESLIQVLHGAFGHRDGVRMILLPDRVSVPQIKTQAIVVAGSDVHLVSIPPLGDRGFEITGRSVIASGQVLRNVVLDEMAELRRAVSPVRGARVFGYVVPTRLDHLDAQDVGGVAYAPLAQAIDLIGRRSQKGLDHGRADVRRAVHLAMPRILAAAEL